MAIGGGTFETQNRILPGTYINFVSAANNTIPLSDRGYAALALELPWGSVGEIFTVTGEDLLRRSRNLFGREYTHPDLAPLRELFRGARVAHLYRLGRDGARAACDLAEARHPGILGNEITLIITRAGEDYTVETLLDGIPVDHQVAADIHALRDNDFVIWNREASLEGTAGLNLSGGTDGIPRTDEYTNFLAQSEAYALNTLGCASTDPAIKSLFARHVKRMREESGIKIQCVLHRFPEADYEGVISVENETAERETGLVYWVTGMTAGCPINRSLTNRRYQGEFTVDTKHTKRELEQLLKGGNFLFHGAGGRDVRVVEDINTLRTFELDRSEDFSLNQTIRVLDQIAIDIATLFRTRYLGIIPNDTAGRLSLWSDIVSHHRQMEQIRAIENFDPADISVKPGESKRSVVVEDYIMPVTAMSKLYMTVVVR